MYNYTHKTPYVLKNVIQHAIKDINQRARIDVEQFSSLRFADDIVLIKRSERHANRSLKYLAEIGLLIKGDDKFCIKGTNNSEHIDSSK